MAKPDRKTAENESRSLLRGAGVFGALTGGSRALGLARNVALTFVASSMLRDSFLLAFSIPNMFRNLFGEGALTNSFVPAYVERLEADDRPGANRLASLVATALFVLLGGLAVLGALASVAVRNAVELSDKSQLVLRLLEVMTPFLPLVCLFAFFIAVLTSHRRFAVPGGAPMLLNVALLGGAYIAFQRFGAGSGDAGYVLAGAVLVGGLAQLVVQLPAAWRCGVRIAPAVDLQDPAFRSVLGRMGPVLPGTAVFQINTLVNRLLAWGLVAGHGALSYLVLSNMLVAAPLGVVAVAMSAAALPVLSSLHARKDRAGFAKAFSGAARMSIFLLLPVTAVLMVNGESIIRLLFERGGWTWEETPRMGRVLFWASAGLVPTALAMLAARAFYAMKKPWVPAKIAFVTVAVNLVLSLLLVRSQGVAGSVFRALDVADPDVAVRWVSGAPGLALATATAIALQAVLLLVALGRECKGLKLGPLAWTLLRTVAITGITAVVIDWVKGSLPPEGEGFLVVFQRAVAPPIAGAFAFWLMASLFEAREYGELWRAIRRKKKKEKDEDEKDDEE